MGQLKDMSGKTHAQRCAVIRYHIPNDTRGLVNEIYKIDDDDHLGIASEAAFEIAFFIGFAYHYSAITTIRSQISAYQLIEAVNSYTNEMLVKMAKSGGLGWLQRGSIKRQYKSRVLEYRSLMRTQTDVIFSGKDMVYPLIMYLLPDVRARNSYPDDVDRILELGESTLLGVSMMFRSEIA